MIRITPSFPVRSLAALVILLGSPWLATAAESETTPPPISIEALTTEVLTSNPELNFYRAEIAAAQAGVRVAGSATNPELSVQAGQKRTRDSVVGLAGGGAGGGFSVFLRV